MDKESPGEVKVWCLGWWTCAVWPMWCDWMKYLCDFNSNLSFRLDFPKEPLSFHLTLGYISTCIYKQKPPFQYKRLSIRHFPSKPAGVWVELRLRRGLELVHVSFSLCWTYIIIQLNLSIRRKRKKVVVDFLPKIGRSRPYQKRLKLFPSKLYFRHKSDLFIWHKNEKLWFPPPLPGSQLLWFELYFRHKNEKIGFPPPLPGSQLFCLTSVADQAVQGGGSSSSPFLSSSLPTSPSSTSSSS